MAGVWHTSGAETGSEEPRASRLTRSATSMRSAGLWNRAPCRARWASARTFMREKVAWRSETAASTARAASARIASPRSSEHSKGRSLRPARLATQAAWSALGM